MKHKVCGIILAGGAGKRMKTKQAKQFLEIAGKPIIMHTLELFDENVSISDIVIVCRKTDIKHLRKLINAAKLKKIHKIVAGGKTRQASSFIGVQNAPCGTKFVLIHDAVRPFADKVIIEKVLSAAKKYNAAGPAIQTEDTFVLETKGFIHGIIDRKNIKRIQTPQAFKYTEILSAHKYAKVNGITSITDDCGLILQMGGEIKLTPGSSSNIKITTRKDLVFAEKYVFERNKNLKSEQ